MKISILGTNGLLSTTIGKFCNRNGFELDMYGLKKPHYNLCDRFFEIDLMKAELNIETLKQSNIIIYAIGAGIQSNLRESSDFIYNLNTNVPIKICNYLKANDYKGVFVTFGSYFEIGENTESILFTEIDLLQSQLTVPNDYSISKRLLSRFASSFKSNFSYWHFILPTIYGETEAAHRLIPYTISAINNNLKLEFTSGDQVRQYIYIEEISEIIFKSFEENLESGIYNISGTECFTVKEIVSQLFELSSKILPKEVFGIVERVDSRMKNLMLDGSKLQKRLNYTTKIKISDVYDRYKETLR